MTAGIYEIRNTTNDKFYVGGSVDTKRRWQRHRRDLRRGDNRCSILQRAWNKYGENAFEFHLLFECDEKYILHFEKLALVVLQPQYNICKVAGKTLGYKHTEETRRKMSNAQIGNTSALGYRHTEKTLRRMRRYQCNRPKEHQRRLNEANQVLMPSEVQQAWSLHGDGKSNRFIARKLGVGHSTINCLINRETYTNTRGAIGTPASRPD